MLLTWTPQAWEDYLYWQATDKRTVKRINELLRDALRNPFEGLGKPAASIRRTALCIALTSKGWP